MYYKRGGFLTSDIRILKLLLNEKKNGNILLENFRINFPDKTLNEDVNAIHVACVSSENAQSGLDHQTFTDLVEIVITTKKLGYPEAIKVIKIVSEEICRIIKNDEYLGQRVTVRSISPVHQKDTFVLKKGHILLQFKTEPMAFSRNDDDLFECCRILSENLKIKDEDDLDDELELEETTE